MKTIKIFKEVEIPLRGLLFFGLGILCGIAFLLSSTVTFEWDFLNKIGFWIRGLPLIFIFSYPFFYVVFVKPPRTGLWIIDTISYLFGGVAGFVIFLFLEIALLLGIGLLELIKLIF